MTGESGNGLLHEKHTGQNNMMGSLSILIPVYNSEKTIGNLVDVVVETLSQQFELLELVLVNDGSKDRSHICILEAIKKHPGTVKYIRLARNFGEHNAVMCGLNYVSGDFIVIIDDDFQNPPSEIVKLVDKLVEGQFDVVYSYYEHKHHSAFRNFGSALNDWFASRLLGKPKGLYLSSFKGIRRNLVQMITQYRGPYPYIDGIIIRTTENIGRQLCRHDERKVGQSNYTIRKLFQLWLNMFTGFSVVPLRVSSIIGIIMSMGSFFLMIFFIISRLVGGILFEQDIPAGWASLMVVVIFFGGLHLCVLGLIGEYLGRLCLTINQTPQFIVQESYGMNKNQEAG